MVTTDDNALAERVNRLRNHGASVSEEARHRGPKPYLLADYDEVGFNYRMTDVQGAIGLAQLRKLDGFIEERQRWAAFYERELGAVSWLRTPKAPEGYGHCWQSYVLYVDEERAGRTRNQIMEALEERGIATRPGTHAVHMLGVYRRRFGLAPQDFPHARDCDLHSMSIPLHNRMAPADFEYVVQALRSLGR